VPDPGRDRSLFAASDRAFVVDALGRSGALDYRIARSGRARLCRRRAAGVDHGARQSRALRGDPLRKPGDVMMIATDEFATAAVIGDVIIGMMKNAGIGPRSPTASCATCRASSMSASRCFPAG
jgi:regulator of RNase E activity RraA